MERSRDEVAERDVQLQDLERKFHRMCSGEAELDKEIRRTVAAAETGAALILGGAALHVGSSTSMAADPKSS